MPFREQADAQGALAAGSKRQAGVADWRMGLPELTGREVTVRELRASDAQSLHSLLSVDEVCRLIAPFPPTVEAWERLIVWMHTQRAEGSYLCYGVVPEGCDEAVGLFQVRQLEPGFGTADWDFALGFPFWGSGVFTQAARLVGDFLFDVVGTHRLEARTAVTNHRAIGALKKIGAAQEGVLRKSLSRGGHYVDQILWTILDDDWRQSRTRPAHRVH